MYGIKITQWLGSWLGGPNAYRENMKPEFRAPAPRKHQLGVVANLEFKCSGVRHRGVSWIATGALSSSKETSVYK